MSKHLKASRSDPSVLAAAAEQPEVKVRKFKNKGKISIKSRS